MQINLFGVYMLNHNIYRSILLVTQCVNDLIRYIRGQWMPYGGESEAVIQCTDILHWMVGPVVVVW